MAECESKHKHSSYSETAIDATTLIVSIRFPSIFQPYENQKSNTFSKSQATLWTGDCTFGSSGDPDPHISPNRNTVSKLSSDHCFQLSAFLEICFIDSLVVAQVHVPKLTCSGPSIRWPPSFAHVPQRTADRQMLFWSCHCSEFFSRFSAHKQFNMVSDTPIISWC